MTQYMVKVWNERDEMTDCIFTLNQSVTAVAEIMQHPFSEDAPVPAGTLGYIVDFADGYIYVDFGAAYGSVCCYQHELN
jgi:hypothetical protein